MIPERYAPVVYSIFRAVVGFLFLCHGLQKFGLFGGIDGKGGSIALGTQIGAAAIIETVCGMLVMLGLFTRPAAFLASGMMAVAYFQVHHPNAPLPLLNMGEPAVLFCFAFLYIAARGGGPISIDASMPGRKRR
jgi:putative oxidoreductase